MAEKNPRIIYPPEYISYIEHGDSAAVFIVRDVVKSINTRGKWIDVLELDGDKNYAGRWDFKKIQVEIFPRKIKPVYPEYSDDAEIRYITWETANRDIANQRRAGFVGEKFEICPKLVNINYGKFKEVPQKEIWHNAFKKWVPLEWRTAYFDYCDENKIREVGTKKIPLKPKWEYYILSIKRL